MSIATLKRKTASKYNNSSVDSDRGFSLNGGYRNQGYVGQTSLSRSITRTLRKGNAIRGHGTCCGVYRNSPIIQSGTCCTEDPSVIKRSVINTKGMLDVRYSCQDGCNVVKPDSNLNANTQGEQVARKQKECLAYTIDVSGNLTKCIDSFGKSNQISCLCTKPESEYLHYDSSVYTQNLRAKCVNTITKIGDVAYVTYVPVSVRREPFC
jgi:hypothetical protein